MGADQTSDLNYINVQFIELWERIKHLNHMRSLKNSLMTLVTNFFSQNYEMKVMFF